MIALYLVFLGAVIIAVGSVLRGYVLTILWGWFIVPVFHLPALSIVPAIGIALVVSFMTANSTGMQDDEAAGSAISAAIVTPVVALVLGWIVHLFM